jgi:hypothetical protein
LRADSGPLDPVFIGYRSDDGRWLDNENREVHPLYHALVPPFDCDEASE